jgi:AcrR family transcriptional regulator
VTTVDPVERKRLIARTTAAIIAADGIDSATVRRIAAELGFSTRSITHYYKDKEQLLDWTCQYMEQEGHAHVSAPLEHDPLALIECLVAMTAIDPKSHDLWKVYLAFWERSARDSNFAAKLESWIERANALVATVIMRRNPECLSAERCARELIALVNGISVQILMQPAAWTAVRVREAIERHVNAVIGPGEPGHA